MKIVLDTNILLVSVSIKSKYYWIFEAFLNREYQLCVTTDILMEYEEIIGSHMGKPVANTVLQIIEKSSNVKHITNYFKWRLIKEDPDDNKFVDCSVSANASYIVTHDRHYNILEQVDFPKIYVVEINKFKDILEENRRKKSTLSGG